VRHIACRLLVAAGLSFLVAGLVVPGARGQAKGKAKGETPKEVLNQALLKAEDEYRLYFKKPVTVPEHWAAITFEMDTGKFDVAALIIDGLLKKQPAKEVDQELAKIEEAKGMSAFLRLREVRKWYDNPELEKDAEHNVDLLINRVTSAVEQRLGDPVRLSKLVKALTAVTPEERGYAFVQLKRARDRAAPYLLDALRYTAGGIDQDRIREAVVRLEAAVVPPLFDALRARDKKDAQDVDLRLALLDIIKRRDDKRAVPYLWHLGSASRYPPLVRAKARQTLAFLLGVDEEKLPAAKEALTQQAEQYYQHRVKFADPARVPVWPWDGRQLAHKPVVLSAAQAEQYFGLLYADEALDLDPAYRPAQEIFLTLTLQGTFARNLDEVLQKKLPNALQRLLGSIDSDLLQAVLERALGDRNLAVILPLVRALGERGEYRAALPSGEGAPGGLLRALYYPDRRVQMAAVKAVTRLPATPEPATAVRVVEILRRFVTAEPIPRALAVAVPGNRAAEVRKALKGAGYDPVLAPRPKEALQQLRAAADIDVVLLHYAVGDTELPFLLGQMRGDRDFGLLPVLVLYTPPNKESLGRIVRRFANVWLMPEGMLAMPDELKGRLEESIKLASAPAVVHRLPASQRAWVKADLTKTEGLRLSKRARRQFVAESMDLLWSMARGEIRGYDLQPLRGTFIKLMRSEDLGPQAIEILGRLPGAEPQQRLAELAVDGSAGKLRLPAALELNRNIRQNGMLLTRPQIEAVTRALANPKEEAGLRAELALVLGQLEPSSRLTGQRLRRYVPDAPAPQKEAPPPQKKKA
jgi:hypothetical protein